MSTQKIAVLIPCYNEEVTIAKVIGSFREVLPEARIYVYDNNSRDGTASVAAAAGAIVRSEPLQGKGNVVRRMFADIDADIYVMVDGDDTYDVSAAPLLIERLQTDMLDMINGRRVSDISAAYRIGHRFGNKLLTNMVSMIFGKRFQDMLSGFRVFSRRFVKSFPALTHGFEIETELTVHALELRMPVAEIDIKYKERPVGSVSKLNTFVDGFRILRVILFLIKEERPLQFFSLIALILSIISIALSLPLLSEYLETGLVPRFPTAILSTGIMLFSLLTFFSGLVLSTITLGRREMKRLHYLQMEAVKPPADAE